MSYNTLTDKYGRPIEEFDILKVYHFTGTRKKKHYMYKMVIKHKGHLYGCHLDSYELKPGFSLIGCNYADIEIVQSKNYEKLEKRMKI